MITRCSWCNRYKLMGGWKHLLHIPPGSIYIEHAGPVTDGICPDCRPFLELEYAADRWVEEQTVPGYDFDACPRSANGRHSAEWYANDICVHCGAGEEHDAAIISVWVEEQR